MNFIHRRLSCVTPEVRIHSFYHSSLILFLLSHLLPDPSLLVLTCGRRSARRRYVKISDKGGAAATALGGASSLTDKYR